MAIRGYKTQTSDSGPKSTETIEGNHQIDKGVYRHSENINKVIPVHPFWVIYLLYQAPDNTELSIKQGQYKGCFGKREFL